MLSARNKVFPDPAIQSLCYIEFVLRKLNMANVITCVRILCGLVLLFLPGFSKWFYACYLTGGLSDALDGWVARRLGEVSDFGARLDTVADILFFGVVLIKVFTNFRFQVWIVIWAVCIAALRILSIVIGFFSSHKLVSEHTVLNKISGLFLFLIPLCIGLFPWQPVAVLAVITCVMATVASIQELYFIFKSYFGTQIL